MTVPGYNDIEMRNRIAGYTCVLGLALVGVGCYNDPEVSHRAPGAGTADLHSRPQVGPGTTAGGSTAGPQPAAQKGHSDVQPTHSGATGDTPGLGHAGAATPEVHPGAGTPAGTQSVTGNQKGVGDRTEEHPPAQKH